MHCETHSQAISLDPQRKTPVLAWMDELPRVLASALTLALSLCLHPSPVDGSEVEETKAKTAPSWAQDLDWLVFVDGYAAYNVNEPNRRQAPTSLRAFDVHNGFSLAWAGFNLDFQKEQFGATAQLRFGPSAMVYNSGEEVLGLQFVKQAYASYKPKFLGGRLSLDLGKFDTPYGAEVAESQGNFNYTRGALNWLGQPFFHTGLRLNANLSSRIDMTLLAVNGWNKSLDNNRGKSFGIQFHLQPIDQVEIFVGYIAGPENGQITDLQCDQGFVFIPTRGCVVALREDDPDALRQGTVSTKGAGARWRHFSDLVISATPHPRLNLLANLDYGYDELILQPITGEYRKVQWYGGMLSANLRWTDTLSTAIRGEWYEDPDGATTGFVDAQGQPGSASIFTATGTLNYSPVPQLSFKLDLRHDNANQDLFAYKETGFRRHQTTLSLGMVVKSE